MFILNTTAAAFAAIAVAAVTLTPAAAVTVKRNGPAPFCIARPIGGRGGGISVHECRYYDYQSCIQAAIGGGNCVRNVDAK
jgi:uncharacterized protein DUF3551